ncbi:MAG TPA: hypothetical protein VG273_11945 [Bryobacteraceae bacterium]|nr:hypothetical protein [Bryobacteraceae bacterium]
MSIAFDPPGLRFYDKASKREMKLIYKGNPFAGWLVYRSPDGQWVFLRKATDADINAINAAVSWALPPEERASC